MLQDSFRILFLNTNLECVFGAKSRAWFIGDELHSVGDSACGAVTLPRLLRRQPMWTHPGAQGPSDINLAN